MSSSENAIVVNPMAVNPEVFEEALQKVNAFIRKTYLPGAVSGSAGVKAEADATGPLPTRTSLDQARSKLYNIPKVTKGSEIGTAPGLGVPTTIAHLLADILPSLGTPSTHPHYYGFVTGGCTPIALLADNLVSTIDVNVHVHLPQESFNTELEQHALGVLAEGIFGLEKEGWMGRIFTTGGTASNLLGMGCGREFVLGGGEGGGLSVGELGLLEVSRRTGVDAVEILCAMPHASIYKSASVIGLGRNSVKDIGRYEAGLPWEFDMEKLRGYLLGDGEGEVRKRYIIVFSWGEVNTGRFTGGIKEVRGLVEAAGRRGRRAWIHVDGAFGAFGRLFLGEGEEGGDESLREVGEWTEGLECADSLAADGHKMLNVPYDCGIFLTKSTSLLHSTLHATAAYLTGPTSSSSSPSSTLPSPLNLGLENSRRFRALPVYAALTSYGPLGYKHIIKSMILHARGIAMYILKSTEYILLPQAQTPLASENIETYQKRRIEQIYNIVLFRARDEELNKVLKEKINSTGGGGGDGRIYVTGTVWEGRPAVRIAVSNWRVGEEEGGEGGWGVVKGVLEGVVREWRREKGEGEKHLV